MADKALKADFRSEASSKLTPVQQMEKAISKKPDDVGLYLELADMHTGAERFPEAEQVLEKALQVSGGDVAVRERLEDAQLRRGAIRSRSPKNGPPARKRPRRSSCSRR